MVSLVSRHYMRGENRKESLMVYFHPAVKMCTLGAGCTLNFEIVEIEKSKNELFLPWYV